jgi:hypothetical protein
MGIGNSKVSPAQNQCINSAISQLQLDITKLLEIFSKKYDCRAYKRDEIKDYRQILDTNAGNIVDYLNGKLTDISVNNIFFKRVLLYYGKSDDKATKESIIDIFEAIRDIHEFTTLANESLQTLTFNDSADNLYRLYNNIFNVYIDNDKSTGFSAAEVKIKNEYGEEICVCQKSLNVETNTRLVHNKTAEKNGDSFVPLQFDNFKANINSLLDQLSKIVNVVYKELFFDNNIHTIETTIRNELQQFIIAKLNPIIKCIICSKCLKLKSSDGVENTIDSLFEEFINDDRTFDNEKNCNKFLDKNAVTAKKQIDDFIIHFAVRATNYKSINLYNLTKARDSLSMLKIKAQNNMMKRTLPHLPSMIDEEN